MLGLLLLVAMPAVDADDTIGPWAELVTQAQVTHTLRAKNDPGTPLPPLANLMVGGRVLSILHLSQYMALNDLLGQKNISSLEAATAQLPALQPELQAAVAGAGKHVLETLLPADAQGTLPLLYAAQAGDLAAHAAALDVGTAAATRLLAERATDGAAAKPDPYLGDAQEAGIWRPTPPAFLPAAAVQWRNVTPYLLASPSAMRPAAPPALKSKQYKNAYLEVMKVGNATSDGRTADHTESVAFWCEQPDTLLFDVLGQVTKDMNLLEASRAYAMAAVAGVDARIVSMDAKYHYSTWRPVTAIPLGNGVNYPAAPFESLVVTPPTPEFPSGHALHGEAILEVCRRLRGGVVGEKAADLFPVSLTTPHADMPPPAQRRGLQDSNAAATPPPPPSSPSPSSATPPIVTRSYASLTEVSQDLALSRVYGGLHYRFTADASVKLGTSLGRRVFESFDSKYTTVGKPPTPPAGMGSQPQQRYLLRA